MESRGKTCSGDGSKESPREEGEGRAGTEGSASRRPRPRLPLRRASPRFLACACAHVRAAKATQPLIAGPDVGLSTLSTPVSRCAQPPPEVRWPLTFSAESSLIGERLVHPNIFCLVAFFYFFFFLD